MKKMLKRKSKGFTLVELLIVIIIIGILAGMMMLSTGGATTKAEAAKVLSDMRNIKTAAVMYYAEENKWPSSITDLNNFLDADTANASFDYSLADVVTSADNIKTTVKDSDIADALEKLSTAVSRDELIFYMPIGK